jgi:HSP20 family molecular chaperone IbpA
MAILKSDGGSDLALLDQMFDSILDWQLPAPRFAYAAAPVDLYEKDGKYVLEVAAPGFDPKDVNEKKDVRYHRREMRRGSFSRTITLPLDLDANSVSATIDKGVLKVELTPIKPIAPKKIEVKPA